VQVFVATHEYLFAKYLEVRKNATKDVLFHALFNGIPREAPFLCREGVNIEKYQMPMSVKSHTS